MNKPQSDADRLRRALERLELTQRAAAQELEISDRMLRYYAAGKVAVPAVLWLALGELLRRKNGARSLL